MSVRGVQGSRRRNSSCRFGSNSKAPLGGTAAGKDTVVDGAPITRAKPARGQIETGEPMDLTGARPAPAARFAAEAAHTLPAALADELADIIADALVAELEVQALLPDPLGERADGTRSAS